MERLQIKYNDASAALVTLDEIMKEPFSKIVRDAAIQRFEYTFEAVWKFLKEYLKEKEGVIANSPKACFKEAFSLSFVNEEETKVLLEMVDDRNNTSHTYKEEMARIIYDKLKNYNIAMNKLAALLSGKI
jgi:nucleotidyltransferase substrate binding protein (TIGR01987 family)